MKPSKLIKSFLTILCILLITSCEKDDYELTTNPINIQAINSVYDDYNVSIYPRIDMAYELRFSTNRSSMGNDFDITSATIYFKLNENSNKLEHEIYSYEETIYHYTNYVTELLDSINTTYNELGPYHIWPIENSDHLQLFASDRAGNLDIYHLRSYYKGHLPDHKIFTCNYATLLNTDHDEGYPALNKNRDELYFTSNRNGDFDIYKIPVPDINKIEDLLATSNTDIIECSNELNSSKDDKCPYILENVFVFSSNREGGFGGFDLYYSINKNGIWEAPENFGEQINSEFDEYRPVILEFREYHKDLMLFSSNRPGGKGGFDLYYTEINKIDDFQNWP